MYVGPAVAFMPQGPEGPWSGPGHHHTHNCFTTLFPGAPGWAGTRRKLLDFMVQGKINRGRHTDHPDGCHSIRTKQCPPPPSPISTGRMPFLLPNQQRQSTEGNRTWMSHMHGMETSCMYVSFGQGSSLLWTYTLRPFYSRPIALTQEGRSLVNDVWECVRDWRVRRGE